MKSQHPLKELFQIYIVLYYVGKIEILTFPTLRPSSMETSVGTGEEAVCGTTGAASAEIQYIPQLAKSSKPSVYS